MVVLLNEAELLWNSVNWENLKNHWSMNWGQFEDPLSYLCLGAEIAYLFHTQELAGWNTVIFLHFFTTSTHSTEFIYKKLEKSNDKKLQLAHDFGSGTWSFKFTFLSLVTTI